MLWFGVCCSYFEIVGVLFIHNWDLKSVKNSFEIVEFNRLFGTVCKYVLADKPMEIACFAELIWSKANPLEVVPEMGQTFKNPSSARL